MRKYFKSFIALLCAAVFALPIFAACGKDDDNKGDDGKGDDVEAVDYAGQLQLDLTTNTKKQEVKVKNYIDGDTTHFTPIQSDLTGYTPSDFAATDGVIKARYIAIDTPESTGDIEKWGKTASKFTRSKLETAEKIIVESDSTRWDIDSTGERYVLWIWYIPEGKTEFRNLNVEILQEGYAWGSSTAQNRYGEIASAALNQARHLELHVFAPANVVDENYYEGDAKPVTLKQLRYHIEDYTDIKVRFSGVVATLMSSGSWITAYVEDYDEADGHSYGMAVFLQTGAGSVMDVFQVGNVVNVVGVCTYYAIGDTYQVSGVKASSMRPGPDHSRVEGTDEAKYVELTAKELTKGTITGEFETDDGIDRVTIPCGEAFMSTSVSMKNLKVVDVYTTPDGDNKGAISLTCRQDNGDGTTTEIIVRTTVLHDENKQLVTEDIFVGKTINVKGIVDKYNNEYNDSPYQIKVNIFSNIEILP